MASYNVGDTSGVFFHAEDTPDIPTDSDANGVLITEDIDIIRNGKSVSKFGSDVRIGEDGDNNVTISNGSIRMNVGSDTVFVVDSSGSIVDTHKQITTNSLSLQNPALIWNVDLSDIAQSASFYVVIKTSAESSGRPFSEGVTFVAGTAETKSVNNLSSFSCEINYDGDSQLTITDFVPNVLNPMDLIQLIINWTVNDYAPYFQIGTTVETDFGAYSLTEGYNSAASGDYSHAEGRETKALGDYSHAEGRETETSATFAHTEGMYTNATSNGAHAEGLHTLASGLYSHAEGGGTSTKKVTASSYASHAEGLSTIASGFYSHAEGDNTVASGVGAHAEGGASAASASYSHAQNYHTKASSLNQTAIGKYNLEDTNDTYSFIIGNGTAENARSNAFTVDWSGNVEANNLVTNVAYDSVNKKITETINGATSDVVTVAALKAALALVKSDVGLGNVSNVAQLPLTNGETTNLNNATSFGFYSFGQTASNRPLSVSASGIVMVIAFSSSYIYQVAFTNGTSTTDSAAQMRIHIRRKLNNTWYQWYKLDMTAI